ncbi:hypothetical protein ASF92_20480 [Pedobacter sp. Leaf176]|nr:hypothetical protein ASF92_20480 [Pedobacter sp. Leaf176]
MNFRFTKIIVIILITSGYLSCKSGSVNLFKATSPHEVYQRKLISAGLDKTALGADWITAASTSMQKALSITVPYQETGYFAAEKANAAAYKFNAVRGTKIELSLQKKPVDGAKIYIDIWKLPTDGNAKLLASADTLGNDIKLDVDETGAYLIRLQPELLRSSEYTLKITVGPSLGFPTQTGKNNIKSFWGDGRDNGDRKHEGVDIFGTFRSPVIATNDGTVVKVNENNLGGKVIWLRPKGKDYTLYYAHLDEQIVKEGQNVLAGDTLGLIGNTGNAKTTAPHLHFGIYTFGGAIDPLPFINPTVKPAAKITASVANLNKTLRTTSKVALRSASNSNSTPVTQLAPGTVVKIRSATSNWYKTELPDGNSGFIRSTELIQVSNPIRKIKITLANSSVYDKPDSLAAVKVDLKEGESVDLLGNFGNYSLISDKNSQSGWIKK